jgi:signal transduction histidine kinase
VNRFGFRDLPLFWKLLVPFMTLMLIVGLVGSVVIVRELSQRAQTQLDADLARKAIEARANVHDNELRLLESANFAANLQGMTSAVASDDNAAVARLLESVLALKPDLDLLVVTRVTGTGLVEFTRSSDKAAPQQGTGTHWESEPFVRDALASTSGDKRSGIVTLGRTGMVAVAAPVCAGTSGCTAEGVAIAGYRIAAVASAARGSGSGAGIYDTEGRALGSAGVAPRRVGGLSRRHPETRTRARLHGRDVETLTVPLTLQSRAIATLAITEPTRPAFASARDAGRRLAVVLFAAMFGIVAIGAVLSRSILRQVRTLLRSNRTLASGDLSARADVLAHDELGELAEGFNEMASQLQANLEMLEMRVEERTEQIRRLLQERTEFFAGLSHEFRTPLAIIRNQATVLAEDADDAGTRRTASMVAGSAAQLLDLVNDILLLARAEADSVEVDLQELDVADTLRALRPTLEELARSRELRFAWKVPRHLPVATADPDRLRQIVLNLVDNAVKYTPCGGRVEFGAAPTAGGIELSVRDSGVGIPESVGDRLFDPFYRVEGTSTMHGEPSTGLGLSVTRRLVEAQGGTIRYTSTPGEGSTFKVELPCARAVA